MSVSVKIETGNFASEAEALRAKVEEQKRKILRGGATAFANIASVKSPPNWGSEVIEEKYYNRTIYTMREVVDKKPRGVFRGMMDIQKIRKGYKFKVIRKQMGKPREDLYFKTEKRAQSAARVLHRGLLRAAWGMNLPSLGSRIPKNIAPLLRRSPRLKKLKYLNGVSESQSDGKMFIEIVNKPAEAAIRNIMIAKKAGEEQAEKYINQELERFAKKRLKL